MLRGFSSRKGRYSKVFGGRPFAPWIVFSIASWLPRREISAGIAVVAHAGTTEEIRKTDKGASGGYVKKSFKSSDCYISGGGGEEHSQGAFGLAFVGGKVLLRWLHHSQVP